MKIGEFAKLSSATIRTLRYYDDLGLLKPDSIDESTGYRIYSSKKLEQMRQIQAMKEIGFTLLEIKGFLAIDDSDEAKKIEFISAKKREIEIERQKTETRLTALDELIVKVKEEREKPMDDKKYYAPFSEDEKMTTYYQDIMDYYKKAVESGEKPYGNINGVGKLVKIYAGNLVFGAIDENGRVCMWGENRYKQCEVPEDLPPIVELGIGQNHVVALDINGRLHGWGSAEHGEINFADDLPKMISVKVQVWNTRALSEDGKVFSWGENHNGNQQYVPRNMGNVKHIAAAAYSAYAVNSENKVFSWGLFNNVIPDVDADITAITAAEYDIVCLGADGKVYGDIQHRQLNKKFKPKPEMSDVKKIAANGVNAAAIDGDGKLYVWGEYAEIMPDGCSVINIPLNLPPIADLTVGRHHDILCLGTDGKVYAWGDYGAIVPPIFDGFKDKPIFEPVDITDVNEPRDVYTFDELCEAVQEKIKNITIKEDMNIKGNSFYVTNDITLIVDKGVTVTVNCMNFFVQKKLINNGIITGGRFGQMMVYDDIGGSGTINTAHGFKVRMNGNKVNANEIGKYLAEDSIYAEVFYSNSEETVISIDRDLVILKGKSLWLNNQCTLKVSEGVTLTVEGEVNVHKKPVIDGTVIGEIRNFTSNERDVYTFEELCEATHQVMEEGKSYRNYNKVTIKANMVADSDYFKIDRISTTILVIDKGVTLTVNCDKFIIMDRFVNNGMIDGAGHIYVDSHIDGTGSVNVDGGLKVSRFDADVSELGKCLAADSIYTEIIYIPTDQPLFKSIFNIKLDGKKFTTTIDRDLVIPKGKSIWVNINSILKITKGATVKIDGEIKTFSEPIIEGEVIGDITVIDREKPRDVYTFDELYEAAKDRVNEVRVKGNITVPFPKDHIFFETLIIDKGVTLTGNSCNFSVTKKLINNGTINGEGRIHVSERIDGENGIDNTNGFEIYVKGIGIDEIPQYLTEDSVYTSVLFISREEAVAIIDNDLVIPKGKSISLNYRYTLKVSEGATLTIYGKVETYNKPIIDGTVIGDITIRPLNP